ncbi:hypothetical protein BU25DRAFT_340873, partial [Macroventuria anomochaeta]
IRLIELLPGAWSNRIRCRLVNVHHENAHYKALSYVWGYRNVKRLPIITVNRKPYSVTVNLESALRHLHQRYPEGLILWVDALCTNQEDVVERTGQVKLMGNIQRKCVKGVVYLSDRLDGPATVAEPPTPVDSIGLMTHS